MPDLSLSPVGLLLATATSVTNVFADVSRKKVMERQELVAATFWVRIFAALVLTVAIVAYAFSGSPPVVHAPAPLSVGAIKDPTAFITRLKQPSDMVSAYLAGLLPATSRQLLADYAGSDPGPLLAGLVKDLNGTDFIKGKLLYEEQHFTG